MYMLPMTMMAAPMCLSRARASMVSFVFSLWIVAYMRLASSWYSMWLRIVISCMASNAIAISMLTISMDMVAPYKKHSRVPGRVGPRYAVQVRSEFSLPGLDPTVNVEPEGLDWFALSVGDHGSDMQDDGTGDQVDFAYQFPHVADDVEDELFHGSSLYPFMNPSLNTWVNVLASVVMCLIVLPIVLPIVAVGSGLFFMGDKPSFDNRSLVKLFMFSMLPSWLIVVDVRGEVWLTYSAPAFSLWYLLLRRCRWIFAEHLPEEPATYP